MLAEVCAHLLVVEDDDQIASPLVRTLEREGHGVERVATGLAGIDRVATGGIDLVLLDLGLPDIDGIEVCRRLRDGGYDGALMILTARGGELDRVVGLDVGADDYLAKPFALAELLARVRALLRRSARGSGPQPEAAADGPAGPSVPGAAGRAAPGTGARPDVALRVDRSARRAWAGDAEVVLTAKEFDLLALLEAEEGRVLTRERLMDEVWDSNWFGSTKTLDTTVGRLRQKLEQCGCSVRITTVRGVGFRLESRDADA